MTKKDYAIITAHLALALGGPSLMWLGIILVIRMVT